MGKSEITFEIFTENYSKIIQALSILHAMSKFKDLYDDEIIGVWNVKYNSHSPTEPTIKQSLIVQDTLQDGDWFKGTEEEYRTLFLLEGETHSSTINGWSLECVDHGGMMFSSRQLDVYNKNYVKTQLTPEEFLRRAENTFKTK